MKGHDRELGMHRAIDRRDFVNGTAVALGAALLPKWNWALALDGRPRRVGRASPTTRPGAPDCAAATPARSRWRTS